MSKKRILITGGAGFIGHHIIEHLLRTTDWEIVSMDRLGTSGNYNRLTDIECWKAEGHRVQFVHHDLRSPINEQVAWSMVPMDRARSKAFDYILHMAASTHVDRSIEDPMAFVLDNVVATTNLLLFAREQEALRDFIYFSTDEVFGPAPEGVAHKEWDAYNSGNPYAAAKAGGEEMALAFANTYRVPVTITHTMNVFGERQHPEKFIPLVIKKVLAGETVKIHANADKTKAGSRFWIHARNVASALTTIIDSRDTKNDERQDEIVERMAQLDATFKSAYFGPEARKGHRAFKFNIVGEREVDNLTMAQTIAKVVRPGMDHPCRRKTGDDQARRRVRVGRWRRDGGSHPGHGRDDFLASPTVRSVTDNQLSRQRHAHETQDNDERFHNI